MAFPLSILLILTSITGLKSTSKVTKVSVKTGSSVSVPCLYSPEYRNNVKYLCEGSSWSSCSYAVKTNNQRSEKYSISDDKIQNIFTVTINQINRNTDYWCAVEIDRGSDDGYDFHLLVTRDTPSLYMDNQVATGYFGENTTINCHYTTSGGMKWCKLGRTCVTQRSGSIDGTRVTINTGEDNVFSVTMSDLSPESSGWYYCVKGDFQMPVHLTVTDKPTVSVVFQQNLTLIQPSPAPGTEAITTFISKENRSSVDLNVFIIPLSLLILIVLVALLVWFVLRHKRAKEDSAKSQRCEEELTYTGVKFKNRTAAQVLGDESDAGVIYSSVAIRQ